MSEISNIRNRIDSIDEQIASLFSERLDITRRIAREIRAQGLPIKNEARESEVLDKVTKTVVALNPANASAARALYSEIFNITCREEEEEIRE